MSKPTDHEIKVVRWFADLSIERRKQMIEWLYDMNDAYATGDYSLFGEKVRTFPVIYEKEPTLETEEDQPQPIA